MPTFLWPLGVAPLTGCLDDWNACFMRFPDQISVDCYCWGWSHSSTFKLQPKSIPKVDVEAPHANCIFMHTLSTYQEVTVHNGFSLPYKIVVNQTTKTIASQILQPYENSPSYRVVSILSNETFWNASGNVNQSRCNFPLMLQSFDHNTITNGPMNAKKMISPNIHGTNDIFWMSSWEIANPDGEASWRKQVNI